MSAGIWFGVFCWGLVIAGIIGRAKTRNKLALGIKAINENRFEDAIQHLLQAESLWKLNSTNGQPATWNKDYGRLLLIVNKLSEAAKGAGIFIDTASLVSQINEHRGIVSNQKNYAMITGVIKKEVKLQSEVLSAEIEVGRRNLRSALRKG